MKTPPLIDKKFPRALRLHLAIILGGWLLLALISTVQRYADSMQKVASENFFSVLFWSLGMWLYWALATPPVFQLAKKIPLNKKTLAYATPIHFLLAFLFGLLHITVLALMGVWFSTALAGAPPTFQQEFVRVFSYFLYLEFVFYWAILGAGIAQDSYQKYRERELQAKEFEIQLSQARLQALKMQLHPHFLFNALNTVSMLIRNREPEQAVQMIAGIGDLLRHSLNDHTAQEVPLAAELAFIRRYLDIEQSRFADRLRVEIDAPGDLLTAQTPNLILQPLVENAIRHGINKSSSANLIRIAAARQNGWLELSVQDNGCGFAKDWQADESQGIGIKNTRARLQQLYGSEQQLIIENAEPNGARVRLKIPYHQAGVEWKSSER
ncbi:MAG: histidine kinase [Acidobacteriota bacterium]